MRNYKNSKRKGFSLEEYIVEKLKPIDKYARPTRNSGASNECLDISNKYFYIEAKQKLTKDNIIVDYKKEWLKSLADMPVNTFKPLLIVTENKQREKFVTLSVDDFFELVYDVYGEKL